MPSSDDNPPPVCGERPDFSKRHERSLGKQRLDESGAFQQQNLSEVEASYEVSIEIAKKKKAHTIGMVKRVLGEASERKIQQISLSDDTVKRRIREMSDDIMEQVIQENKSSPSEFEEEEGKLVRNPFSGTPDIAAIPDDGQDEFLDLRNDSVARDLYEEKSLTVFWCSMYQSYPKVSEIVLRVLLPFSSPFFK
ncbi:ZBED8-like 4 [Homarus americanus]|uniref:ZBED8-like 4 n=1 Tax=Homarus americanus TaxID=6706 RepID=A0A8J5MMN1_HOMAM|nr:ZBED8-like 4 [Homarus americanus]